MAVIRLDECNLASHLQTDWLETDISSALNSVHMPSAIEREQSNAYQIVTTCQVSQHYVSKLCLMDNTL